MNDTTTKEGFSGPSKLIRAGKKAARATYGNRNGSWSHWVIDAIREKLVREGRIANPARGELLAAAEEVGGDIPAAQILRNTFRQQRKGA
jgi:hypothetical protein